MIAYEIYWCDENGADHFVGTLPERRKNRERITKESIVNWGKKVIGDYIKVKDIFFTQVEID
jgi:hypothetical protein